MSGITKASILTAGETSSEASVFDAISGSVSTVESELANLSDVLKNKALATKGRSPKEKEDYNKKMLAAAQNTKPPILSEASKRTVAAVVPGALGVLQPSGPTLHHTTVSRASSATREVEQGSTDLLKLQKLHQQHSQYTAGMYDIAKTQHDVGKSTIRNIR